MAQWLENFFAIIGTPFVSMYRAIVEFGRFLLFQIALLPLFVKPPLRIKETFVQMDRIGIQSVGVISLTALFTGLVEAIQLFQGFHQFGADNFVGYTVFISISRELGPVFAGLMLTSRAVSSMAAELGTMRVTEQIDAIETLAVDSKKYLVIPRIVAATLSLPLLVLFFDFLANLSAYTIASLALDINPVAYQDTIQKLLDFSDIGIGIIKGFVFGFLVASVGTYMGYNAAGGAKGVGLATTKSVVYASITIFGANYFLSSIFLFLDW